MSRYIIKYQNLTPFQKLRERQETSERDQAAEATLSRVVLRQLESPSKEQNPTLKSLCFLAQSLERDVIVLVTPENECEAESSTLAVSYHVLRDGFESWKIHFMELVDTFRKTLDPRLILLPPAPSLDAKLKALLASMVLELCEEAQIGPPTWATRSFYLEKPWFPSGMESLKATSIVESPLSFRRNNIFVQENILKRA